jgi:hypothetical protein
MGTGAKSQGYQICDADSYDEASDRTDSRGPVANARA